MSTSNIQVRRYPSLLEGPQKVKNRNRRSIHSMAFFFEGVTLCRKTLPETNINHETPPFFLENSIEMVDFFVVISDVYYFSSIFYTDTYLAVTIVGSTNQSVRDGPTDRRYVMNMVEGDRIHDLHLDGPANPVLFNLRPELFFDRCLFRVKKLPFPSYINRLGAHLVWII